MCLKIKIYALLLFLLCQYCSVKEKESDPKSEFENFKNTYYENINKKFEDDHSIYITLESSNTLSRTYTFFSFIVNDFFLGFRLAKEEMIEIDSSNSYHGYVEGLDYPDEKRIMVPDMMIMMSFYLKMKMKRNNFGYKPWYGYDIDCCFLLHVYLKREEAKILLEKIDKYYNNSLNILYRKYFKPPPIRIKSAKFRNVVISITDRLNDVFHFLSVRRRYINDIYEHELPSSNSTSNDDEND